MSNVTPSAPWGSLALVSYIPEPLGSFLHDLRRILPGDEQPQAHITILPPRPLKLPLEMALQQAGCVLDRFSSFAVHLSKVDCFTGTKILYLDLSGGVATLREMHSALNKGDLGHDEPFEFRPHLTIGGPVSPENLEPVRIMVEETWRASRHSPGFTVEEIIGLWSPLDAAAGDWKRCWCYRLKPLPAGSGLDATVGATRTS